jgi:hypothetical protein
LFAKSDASFSVKERAVYSEAGPISDHIQSPIREVFTLSGRAKPALTALMSWTDAICLSVARSHIGGKCRRSERAEPNGRNKKPLRRELPFIEI